MTQIELFNRSGKVVGQVDLRDEIFAQQVNGPIMHQAVLVYQNSLRSGTAATKTRGLVRGGGRKPWRQKGTGRARAGSSRSPIWRGGGVIFGPGGRSYEISMPRKMRRAALLSALSLRALENKVKVVDEFTLEAPKTKEAAGLLKSLNAENALLVVERGNANALLSAANLPKVSQVEADSLNTYDVLRHENLVLTKQALDYLEEVLINA
ncbi:MAG: 50S ribosomal protein L4 [Clostridiales bacterium]|nr:50S ribosomal protein L4 [Clostridiales bacterium]